jgi:catechol-2,3-dioxygenase
MSGAIRRIGEIALRVQDLNVMAEFYEHVIGLRVMKRFPASVFFKIADGYAGHTQILALFDRSGEVPDQKLDGRATTLDHVAFSIALKDYDLECERLESHRIAVRKHVFEWVQWRSLFLSDPEGNTVEFVCYDDSIVQE